MNVYESLSCYLLQHVTFSHSWPPSGHRDSYSTSIQLWVTIKRVNPYDVYRAALYHRYYKCLLLLLLSSFLKSGLTFSYFSHSINGHTFHLASQLSTSQRKGAWLSGRNRHKRFLSSSS